MVTYRNLKSLDPLTFSASLHASLLSAISSLSCPAEILSLYNDYMLHIFYALDALAVFMTPFCAAPLFII